MMTFRQQDRLRDISRDIGTAAVADTQWARELRRKVALDFILKDNIEECAAYVWGLADSPEERSSGAKAWQIINLYNNHGLTKVIYYCNESRLIESGLRRRGELRSKGLNS